MVFQRGFVAALVAGLLTALALGLGWALTFFMLGFEDEGMGLALYGLGMVMIFMVGTTIVGGFTGMAASRWSSGPGSAMGAAAIATIMGIFLITIMLAFGLLLSHAVHFDDAESGFVEEEEEPVDWGFMMKTMALLFIPGTITSTVTAALGAPPAQGRPAGKKAPSGSPQTW